MRCPQYGALWLQGWCARANGQAESSDELLTAAACAVVSDRSGDEMAAELFELLGDAVFDVVSELLEHRRALTTNIHALIEAARGADAAERPAAMPTYGTAVQ